MLQREYVMATELSVPMVVITDENAEVPFDLARVLRFTVEDELDVRNSSEIVGRIVEIAAPRRQSPRERVDARLRTGETTMALLETVVAVEVMLRDGRDDVLHSLASLPSLMMDHPALSDDEQKLIRQAYQLRSLYLHKGVEPNPAEATELSQRLINIIDRLDPNSSRP